MRALVEAGIEVDIFPIYPLEPSLWRYVPDILSKSVLPESKVHHLRLAHILTSVVPFPLAKFGTFLRDAATTTASAVHFGIGPLAKNTYVLLKGWIWAQQHPNHYDHILAYWGNYAATCAYIYHRLTAPQIPFSIFFHAGIDLYTNQVYLRQKLIYADNIIVVCKFNRQFIHDNYKDIFYQISDKIYVHHLGLDLWNFPFEPDARSLRKVIAVGRLSREKGFDYLLRAVHELRCRGIDIEVEFVGDGPEAKFLRTLTYDLHLWERVQFKGWLYPDEVRTAMRKAAILAHPSSGLGDAVPTVIKESMALGTPVIASNIAGIPELLDNGRCGVLVPPKDVKVLANAIEMLLTNVTLQKQYAKIAREYAEKKFDLWRNGHDLAKLLRSTMRKNPPTLLRH
jgi:colanic acid/amylovoran biosynthesis glycosyltransferase